MNCSKVAVRRGLLGRRWRCLPVVLAWWVLAACSDSTTEPQAAGEAFPGIATSLATGQGGHGLAGAGAGGHGGQGASQLENLLGSLRANPEAAMLEQSQASGWPAPVAKGHLFVSLQPGLDRLAGDHDAWSGTPMQHDQGFAWLVLQVSPGSRYKFSDGQIYQADPWSRAYHYDDYGMMSQLPTPLGHLERHFAVGNAVIAKRTVRLWLPTKPTHVLYAHDGQNLFDPTSPWGGWDMRSKIPSGTMVVAIDNGPERMEEYTHVVDDLGMGLLGGKADDYVEFVNTTVRNLVAKHYGEPTTRGILGSSLGGLVSLYAAHRHPEVFAFAASMSGTLGWGSIGLQNKTIIETYRSAAPDKVVLYIDSGGGGTCLDTDEDGILDDGPNGSDNYCVSKQLRDELVQSGRILGQNLFYEYHANAAHNEKAWGARVAGPLKIFSEL